MNVIESPVLRDMEKKRAIDKKSYAKNSKEKIRKKVAKRQANPEKSRAYYIEWYARNSKKKCDWVKRWRKNNPDDYAASSRNRKALKRNAEGSHTASDIQQLLVLQKNKCAVCRISIANEYHVDHVIPLSLGGTNDKGNLQLLCPHCNLSKGAKHPIDFMQSRGLLL